MGGRDGAVEGPDDAWGFGQFPGQYGMVVLSRYPILTDQVRTFQNLRWADMPQNLLPTEFYGAEVAASLRLSSKSHWDVPVQIGSATLHVLAALGETDRPLSSLLSEFSRYVGTGEINSTVADQAAAVARIEQEYGALDGVELDHLDGLTVLHRDWWFNVRASNTEPLLRLNAEAGDQATLDRLRDDVLATIRRDS